MQTTQYQLCQVNIAHAKEAMDHPVMTGFVSRLDEINALADSSPGFVWRLQSDTGNATDIILYENPRIIYNMSVWDSVEALFEYSYKSQHAQVLAQRKDWFIPMEGPYMALWWIQAGQLPPMDEGKKRLEHLAQFGPTLHAFSFKQAFPAPDQIGIGCLVSAEPINAL